jgi:3-methyladenine DNA glycosylase AlkD
MAKRYGPDHVLALALWEEGWRETRLLATMVDDPDSVTEAQLDSWVADLDSWDICDALCTNLIRQTPFAREKIFEWVERPETFVRRAGFVMIAVLAVHQKSAPDSYFDPFWALIQNAACDQRNFVKKAVNWALRQIGKRNSTLRARARQEAVLLLDMDCPAASWIARDALREFDKVDQKEALKHDDEA